MDDFAIGETVTTSWTTKAGNTRMIVGTVREVSPTRVQIRYESTSIRGRSFSWNAIDRWAKKQDVQRCTVSPVSSLQLVEALLRNERAKL